MAVAFVKKNSGQSGAASTTLTATLASAPAAGDLLVFVMAGDKNTGALTLSGFTQQFELLSTSVSLYMYYKISDGSETSISPTWATSSVQGNAYWYGVYTDAAVSGNTWQVSATASNITNETTVSSASTGTTGAITATGLALAVAAIDNAQNAPDGSTGFSNGYTARHLTLVGAGARGGIYLAEKAVTGGTTTDSTFSYTPGTLDQLSGAVAVFTKVSADIATTGLLTAGGSLTATTGHDITPHGVAATGVHLGGVYTKESTPLGVAATGVHLSATVGHTAIVYGRIDMGVALRGQIPVSANDKIVYGRIDTGVALRATVGHFTQPEVPVNRTYRPTGSDRTYRVPPKEDPE